MTNLCLHSCTVFGDNGTHLVLEIAFVCDAGMHMCVSVSKASHMKQSCINQFINFYNFPVALNDTCYLIVWMGMALVMMYVMSAWQRRQR